MEKESTTQNEVWKRRDVKSAKGALLFISVATFTASLLSIWIPFLRNFVEPTTMVLGAVLFVTYYFVTKKSVFALIVGTTIFTADAVLMFLLSGMAALNLGIVLKVLLIFLLLRGTMALLSGRKEGKRELIKGIAVGVGIIIAFMLFVVFMYAYVIPLSPDICYSLSGDAVEYEGCLFGVSVKLRDPTSCQDIVTNPNVRELCFAASTYDSSMCEEFGANFGDDHYNYCIAMTSRTDATSHCQDIINKELRDECLTILS